MGITSGVMRITVTVVVIMFELTGALTYILPTMIVLLVTKAVGDFLGTNGIADEMIRFNEFPFLEREDHAYNATVSKVMRRDLYTIFDTGMYVQDVESLLASRDVKGFPIVSADGPRKFVGFISRTDIRYVLERTRSSADIHRSTPCIFIPLDADTDSIGLEPRSSFGVGEEVHDSFLDSALSERGISFSAWVNRTTMTVSPQLPLEILVQLFKRMGPRIILVEDRGLLIGLVTVKDVLRFIATEKNDHGLSWDERGGLDGVLEEAWAWARNVVYRTVFWSRRLLRYY